MGAQLTDQAENAALLVAGVAIEGLHRDFMIRGLNHRYGDCGGARGMGLPRECSEVTLCRSKNAKTG